jgi:hypothetical protein
MAARRSWLTFTILLALAWVSVAGVLLAARWPEMGQRLFDADDAMRLVEVRELVSGRAWFDLHESRLNPPVGYDTHWSRLIDAGQAGLYVAFAAFTQPDLAERLMRAVWPLLWLLAAITGVAALSWRIAGRDGALIALVLSACAVPAFQHFNPGRIDHHNVQIALSLAVAAAAAWSDRRRHAGALAGAFTGLAAAVGLEGLPFLATSAAVLALRSAWSRDGTGDGSAPHASPRLLGFGLALAASGLLGFLADVAPAQWTRPACDAMAINWVAATTVGGLGIALVAWRRPRATLAARLAAIAFVGAAAFLAFVAIEPRCLAGPFALTDQAVKAIWLGHVDEMEPLIGFVRGFPLVGAWLCSFPLVAVVALFWLARDRVIRGDFGFQLAAAVFVVAVAATFGAEKVYSYAMWFAMPLVAALIARLVASPGWRAWIARLAAAAVLTPTSVTAAALIAVQSVTAQAPARPGIIERAQCTRNDAYAPLAPLAPGLVATDINYGPYVLALTHHAVVAAPYHRIVGGLIAAHTIVTAPPAEARRVIDTERVSYLALCGARTSTGELPPEQSLWAELEAGQIPDWLERVPGSREDQFTVYRVRRTAGGPPT